MLFYNMVAHLTTCSASTRCSGMANSVDPDCFVDPDQTVLPKPVCQIIIQYHYGNVIISPTALGGNIDRNITVKWYTYTWKILSCIPEKIFRIFHQYWQILNYIPLSDTWDR